MSKREETQKQIDIMLKGAKVRLHQMTKVALASGALSEEMKQEGNWLLAKAVMDIWCSSRPFSPLDGRTKEEVANLSHFI